MYTKNGENELSGRIKIIYFFILMLFLIITIRLWILQIFKGDYYYNLSKKNLIKYEDIFGPRGLIKDRKGRIIAENLPSYAIGIVRENCIVKRKDIRCIDSIKKVSSLIKKNSKELIEKYQKDKRRIKSFEPIIIARDMDINDISKIEVRLRELPGVVVIPYPTRFYPYGEVGAHVLGYVGEPSMDDLERFSYLQPGDVVGKDGVERSFETSLRGIKGKKRLVVDALGRTLIEKVIKNTQKGKDVTLTLDMDLEKYIYMKMENKVGACVVMEPYSGDVVGLVSVPSFDNTRLSHGLSPKEWKRLISDKRHPLQNRAISSTYPPGSVFKLVVGLLGMKKHVDIVDMNDKRVYCPGFYKMGNRVFRCWKKGGHGRVNFKEALKQSCDVYFYRLGEELGIDSISSFAKKCGFGKITRIHLVGESPGFIPSREWKMRRFGVPWQKGETLITSIGQGFVLVSPLQVARFISSIVNGGKILRPRISFNESIEVQDNLPVEEKMLSRLRKIMVATVEEKHGTAGILKTKGITIGAKTGTAQVVTIKSEEERHANVEKIPYEKRDHAWMASFATNGTKTYVVVCIVEHGGHGASGAGPIVRDVIRYLFRGNS